MILDRKKLELGVAKMVLKLKNKLKVPLSKLKKILP